MSVSNNIYVSEASGVLDALNQMLLPVRTGTKIVNIRSIKVSSGDLPAGDTVQIYIMEKNVTAGAASPEDFAAYFKDETSDYVGAFCLVRKELGIDYVDEDSNQYIYIYFESAGGAPGDVVDLKIYWNSTGSGG